MINTKLHLTLVWQEGTHSLQCVGTQNEFVLWTHPVCIPTQYIQYWSVTGSVLKQVGQNFSFDFLFKLPNVKHSANVSRKETDINLYIYFCPQSSWRTHI